MEIIDVIPLEFTAAEVVHRLKLKNNNEKRTIDRLLKTVRSSIKARAVYATAFIEKKSERAVVVDGQTFTSSVLRKNLDDVGRIFPFVVTIGAALETEIRKNHELIEQFYLDAIGNLALNKARDFLTAHLQSKYALKKISNMSPGSLPDWPLEEQGPLFAVIGDVETAVGVRLSDHYLMIPAKSVSGILFPTEILFYSCRLCPREKCPGRKAAFDRQLIKEYGLTI